MKKLIFSICFLLTIIFAAGCEQKEAVSPKKPVAEKGREKPLFKILKDLKGPFESNVIRSLQLAPGVGGFKPESLLDLLKNMAKSTKPHRSILISTASRCGMS
jgi:hypothetical protein